MRPGQRRSTDPAGRTNRLRPDGPSASSSAPSPWRWPGSRATSLGSQKRALPSVEDARHGSRHDPRHRALHCVGAGPCRSACEILGPARRRPDGLFAEDTRPPLQLHHAGRAPDAPRLHRPRGAALQRPERRPARKLCQPTPRSVAKGPQAGRRTFLAAAQPDSGEQRALLSAPFLSRGPRGQGRPGLRETAATSASWTWRKVRRSAVRRLPPSPTERLSLARGIRSLPA
jgi:hypothetical protein